MVNQVTPNTLRMYAVEFIIALCVFCCTILWHRIVKRPDGRAPEACKKLGLHGASNITDEHETKYDGPEQVAAGKSWTVKSLWIYPVKSCKGVELEQGTITGLGMRHDRQLSFAHFTNRAKKTNDPPDYGWSFLTQRQIPALATVRTEVWLPDPCSPDYSTTHPNVLSGGVVVMRWPHLRWTLHGRELAESEHAVQLPLDPTPEQIKANGYEAHDMAIWRNEPTSWLLAKTIPVKWWNPMTWWSWIHRRNGWIADLLSYLEWESKRQNPIYKGKTGAKLGFTFDLTKPFALFRLSNANPRQVFRNAPTKEKLGYQPIVGFQDAYPLHILNLASVHDVAAKLPADAPPLSIVNFRPNIIITGGCAFAEDDWRRVTIGEADYDVSCRTGRCRLPNVDQRSGKMHASEPDMTMRKKLDESVDAKRYRCIDEGIKGIACLGMQMVPMAQGPRRIHVGDVVDVLEVGEHKVIRK